MSSARYEAHSARLATSLLARRSLTAALLGLLLGSPAHAVGAALAVALGTVIVSRRAPSNPGLSDDALAEVFQLAARGVRSGLAAAAALDEAARTAGLPAPILSAESTHLQLRARLDRWAAEVDVPAAHTVAAAIGVATAAGADPARAFDAAARSLHGRAVARRELLVASSQARASAALMGLAPGLLFALSALLDPATVRRACADPLALACVVAGCMLEGLGLWWMQRLLRSVRPA